MVSLASHRRQNLARAARKEASVPFPAPASHPFPTRLSQGTTAPRFCLTAHLNHSNPNTVPG